MAIGYEGYLGYGQPVDPTSVAMRLAQAQLMSGMDTSPIRSKYQGYARLAQALMGGLALRQAQQTQAGENLTPADLTMSAQPVGPIPGGTPMASMGGQGGGGLTGGPGPSLPPDMTAPNNSAGGLPPAVGTGGGGAPYTPVTASAQGPRGVQVASANPNFMPSGFTSPSPASQPGAGGSGAALVQMQQAQDGLLPAEGGNPMLGRITQMGYSPIAAAGILGNFQQESRLDPNNDTGDGGTSIGLGQWHASRAQALMQFAQAQGSNWRDPNIQLAFMDREIKQNPQLYQALNSAQTPQQAADIFMSGFERPRAGPTAMQRNREDYAAAALRGGNSAAMVAGPGAPSNPEAYGTAVQQQGTQPQPGQMHPQYTGPNIGRVMEVMQNPYASPATKQLAEMFMQQYMTINGPHPYTYQAIPGTNNERQLDFWGNPTGSVLQGGPKTEKLAPGEQLFQLGPNGLPVQGGGQAQGGAVASNNGIDYAAAKAGAEETAKRNAGLATPTTEDYAKVTQGARGDESYKDADVATNAYNSMVRVATIASHASDKSLIDSYARIMNPGRAVGVGQYKINADIQSMPDEIKGEIAKAWNGGPILSGQTRAAMLTDARMRVEAYQSSWKNARSGWLATAKHGNIDESAVPDVIQPMDPDWGSINRYGVDAQNNIYDTRANNATVEHGRLQEMPGQPAPTAPIPASKSPIKTPPQPGDVVKGYRFKGGDPSQQGSWEPAS